MSSAPTFAIITGGGTGGHVYPAIAIADALVARGHGRSTIHFVGARRGLEARVVPEVGYTIDALPGRGFQRRLALTNLRTLAESICAFVQAWRILGARRPAVVVGVGGYASLPTVLAARLRRIPVVVHEQNAAPGLANRISVRLGARAAASWPDTPLRDVVITGNPVRADITRITRREDSKLIGIVGGSLGARRLNEAALGLYDRWRHRTDVSVRHVVGVRNLDDCEARLAVLRGPQDVLRYELVGYEDHMDELYATAGVIVGRAGAVTLAELAAAGVPAVLVPLPGATDDHQSANARSVARAGAAIVIPDAEATPDRLAAVLDELRADGPRLDAMSKAARSLARPDAADAVAALAEQAAA